MGSELGRCVDQMVLNSLRQLVLVDYSLASHYLLLLGQKCWRLEYFFQAKREVGLSTASSEGL